MGHLIGWSGGDATGYSAEYYFDSEGRYLGPDHDGVEPLFNLEDYEVAARDNGKKGGRPVEIIGRIYYYDNGQCLAEFRRGGPNDWFVWSPKAGQRLKTYRTQGAVMESLEFVKKSYPDDMPSLHQLELALDGLLPG